MRGRLLVATPDLRDPNFSRTVVLMLEHGDDGALGVVLNRPIELSVADVLPDWAELSSRAGLPVRRRTGGTDVGDRARAGRRAASSSCCSTVSAPWTWISTRRPTRPRSLGLRVFVGYAGWSPGQLELELSAGGWLVLDLVPDDPFSHGPVAALAGGAAAPGGPGRRCSPRRRRIRRRTSAALLANPPSRAQYRARSVLSRVCSDSFTERRSRWSTRRVRYRAGTPRCRFRSVIS